MLILIASAAHLFLIFKKAPYLRTLYKKGHLPLAGVMLGFLYPLLLLSLAAFGQYQAHGIKSDTRQGYHMTGYYTASVIAPIKKNKNLRYIGKTGSHLFLWDADLAQTQILRAEAVNHFAIDPK